MDPINPVAQSPETPQTPKDSHGVTIAAMAIFVLLSLAAVAFLYYQNQQLKTMLASYQTPVSTPVPSATPDVTANWKTYTNSVQRIAFKYPLTWQLDNKGDQEQLNAQLSLTKGQAIIKMYFSMDGIGGQGQAYEGTPYILDGHSLYRFVTTNTYNNTRMVGVSTSLTETLGVFEVNGKTYSITLTYPMSEFQTEAGNSLEKEFDQVLSTFKFISPSASPSAKPVACTQEAKLCPNGSYVGRTGPNCEFAPCPTP
jgi:hypothetical protein